MHLADLLFHLQPCETPRALCTLPSANKEFSFTPYHISGSSPQDTQLCLPHASYHIFMIFHINVFYIQFVSFCRASTSVGFICFSFCFFIFLKQSLIVASFNILALVQTFLVSSSVVLLVLARGMLEVNSVYLSHLNTYVETVQKC